MGREAFSCTSTSATCYGHAPGADTKISTTGFPANGVTGTFGNYGGGGAQIPEAAGNLIVDWDGATGNPATSFFSLKGKTSTPIARSPSATPCSCTRSTRAGRQRLHVRLGRGRPPAVNFVTSLGGNDRIGSAAGGTDAGRQLLSGTPRRTSRPGTLHARVRPHARPRPRRWRQLNNKPNYLSVMNYGIGAGPGLSPNIQMCAVPAIGGLPGGCDYSRIALPTLNEVNPPGLDECAGYRSRPRRRQLERRRWLDGCDLLAARAATSRPTSTATSTTRTATASRTPASRTILGALPGLRRLEQPSGTTSAPRATSATAPCPRSRTRRTRRRLAAPRELPGAAAAAGAVRGQDGDRGRSARRHADLRHRTSRTRGAGRR